MRWYVPVFALAGALMAAPTTARPAGQARHHQDRQGWPYPLVSGPAVNPVLTRSDVTDTPAAFVADPFLIHQGRLWYMFFEVWSWPGVISVATSLDGYDWVYDQVVLREDTHISYPHVFSYDDGGGEQYYMVVESGATQTVPLYKSAAFPYQWNLVSVLASGREFADPTVFRWNGTWWMFVSPAYGHECYLYYSDHLEYGWVEHPQSPVVQGRSKSRPAGRVMIVDGTRVLRLAQKCDIQYGEAVRVFEVDVLTRTAYAEHEVPDSPILEASGQGWNAEGMHQCDQQWTGGSWLAAVDGLSAGQWSIGIYTHYTDPTSVTAATPTPLPLRAYPNPLRAGQEVRLVMERPEADRPVSLEITDAGGRSLHRISSTAQIARRGESGSPLSIAWTAKGNDGRELSPGVYFVRATNGRAGDTQQTKIVVTR